MNRSAAFAVGWLALTSSVVACGRGPSQAAAVLSARVGGVDRPLEVVSEDGSGRLVRHPLGTTHVSNHPQRILSLDMGVTDALIQLGLRPLATPLYGSLAAGGFIDYQRPFLAGVAGLTSGSSPEAYLTFQPDLIFSNAGGNSSLALLERIAPTVVVGSVDPRQKLLDVGTALGLKGRAQERIAEYDAKVIEARRLLAPHLAGQTVALLRLHMKQYRLYGDKMQSAPVFYQELGMRPCPLVQRTVIDTKLDRVWLNEEQLAEIDADQIFLIVDPAARERTLELLSRNPVWSSLPAVRNGQVHITSTGFATSTLLARERVIDDVLAAFGQEPLFGL